MRSLVSILLILLSSAPATLKGNDFEHLLEGWTSGALLEIQKVQIPVYLGLTDEEIAVLAPRMARWIPIREVLASYPDATWKSFRTEQDWTPFLNALSPTDPFRNRWGMSHAAAWSLRCLAEKRCIARTDVIPDLIEGLDHPSHSFTGRDSFYALTALTRLYDGPLTNWSLENVEQSKIIADWFRNWWTRNREKNVILTPLLESQIRERFLELATILSTAGQSSAPSLRGFRPPDRNIYHRVGEPLFEVEFDGEGDGSRGRGKGWLRIMINPGTPLLHSVPRWERYPQWDATLALPGEATLLHREVFPETDWVITVHTKRVPETERTLLTKLLSE